MEEERGELKELNRAGRRKDVQRFGPGARGDRERRTPRRAARFRSLLGDAVQDGSSQRNKNMIHPGSHGSLAGDTAESDEAEGHRVFGQALTLSAIEHESCGSIDLQQEVLHFLSPVV